LSIGLLVDDAIVVIENVERIMREEQLSPRDATRKSMQQITGALIAIALVLSAVFVPMAFFGGSTGVIYRQFSVTIVSAMVLSIFVALVLTPALCATLLKPVSIGHAERTVGSSRSSTLRSKTAARAMCVRWRFSSGKRAPSIVVYGVIVAVMAVLIVRMPTGFFPAEDQGGLFTPITLPVGRDASRARSRSQSRSSIFYLEDEKANVHTIFIVAAFSFAGQGQNTGQAFVNLTVGTSDRARSNSAQAIVGRAFKTFSKIRDAQIFPLLRRRCVNLAIRRASKWNSKIAAISATTR